MSGTERWASVRVMVVDDKYSDHRPLMHALEPHRTTVVTGGIEALEWIAEHGQPHVLITEQYTRSITGIELLRRMRKRHPRVVCVLISKLTDIEQALTCVNAGEVFQIALNTWPQERLQRTVGAALRQAELLRAEREIIESTLAGTIHALGEALALANPVALGHTLRVAKRVDSIAARMNAPKPWEISMATQLSQLGTIHIPAGVLERVLLERDLKDWEAELYSGSPQRAVDMLKDLPSLDGVRDIIRWQQAPWDGRTREGPKREEIPLGARILHVAMDADRLEMQGHPAEAALAALTQRQGVYDTEVLEVLRRLLEEARAPREFVRSKVSLTKLWAGMIFAEDLYTDKGLLLTSKGTTASASLLERIRSFALAHGLQAEVDMYVPILEPAA